MAGTLGPIMPGVGGRVENDKCAVDGSLSSVMSSGNTVVLKLAITFKAAAAGPQYSYAMAYDMHGLDSGWTSLGSWTVPALNRPPSILSISPKSGTGSSQTFTLAVSDPDGAGDLATTVLVLNGALTGRDACFILYHHSPSRLYLATDDGASTLGPIVPGTPGRVENSKCAVDSGISAAIASGNTATLQLTITFKAPAAGTQYAFALVYDRSGADSGWQYMGSWAVPVAAKTLLTPGIVPLGLLQPRARAGYS